MKRAPQELIEACRHRLDAIRLAVQLSGMSNEYLCSELGIDRGHWSRIMQGHAYFPDTKSIALMELCGSYAPLQYELWALGLPWPADETREEMIARKRRELRALEGAT